MTEQGASVETKVRRDKRKVIYVYSPSGVHDKIRFKPSQFKNAFRNLVTFYAKKHCVPEDVCKWYCATGNKMDFKDELDLSLSLPEYIETHGEDRRVLRGKEECCVYVGLLFTKKRCEMQWPRSENALAPPTPGLADMSIEEDTKPDWASLPLHIIERVYRHLNNPDDLTCAMLVCKQWSLDSPDKRVRAMATGLVEDKDDLNSPMNYRFNGKRLGGATLMQRSAIKKLDVQGVRGLLAAGVRPLVEALLNAVMCDAPEPQTIAWWNWKKDQPPCEDHIAMARVLIDAGADNVDFVFPFACEVAHLGMVAALIDTGKVSADVMNAAVASIGLIATENAAMIRLLVERGASLNVATDLGKDTINPLMNAIMHCDANMVRLLVELGADVNFEFGLFGETRHETPLSMATCPGGEAMPEEADEDFWEIREILKAAGAVL